MKVKFKKITTKKKDNFLLFVSSANCGPAPHPVNSEVIWHNRSAVLHGCMKGHHSWKGSNMSVCDDTGKWQEATLRCRGICHEQTSSIPLNWNTAVMTLFQTCLFVNTRKVNIDVICSDLSEIKPAISELAVFNDKCLRWKAEKYEDDTENYRVSYE